MTNMYIGEGGKGSCPGIAVSKNEGYTKDSRRPPLAYADYKGGSFSSMELEDGDGTLHHHGGQLSDGSRGV